MEEEIAHLSVRTELMCVVASGLVISCEVTMMMLMNQFDEVSVCPLLQFRNSHECSNEDMLWQTVQVLVHAGTRMIVDSCVAVPAASSTWTVQRRRSCEDRSGLCVSVERQGRHTQLNAGTDGWGSWRPVDTWWRDSSWMDGDAV